MPKRFGKRETLRQKFKAKAAKEYEAAKMFFCAFYDPHFARSLRALRCFPTSQWELWCESAEQCLDRTEVQTS